MDRKLTAQQSSIARRFTYNQSDKLLTLFIRTANNTCIRFKDVDDGAIALLNHAIDLLETDDFICKYLIKKFSQLKLTSD